LDDLKKRWTVDMAGVAPGGSMPEIEAT